MKLARTSIMRIIWFVICLVCFLQVCTSEDERSFLDNYLPVYRIFRGFTSNILRTDVASRDNRQLLKRKNKRFLIPKKIKFPCDLSIMTRSKEIPKTVDAVRPGDIDVIGALGDSLTAGFGISATNIGQLILEERGKSFSIGGEGTWRTGITLPNILKMFNPNLIGYSLRAAQTTDKGSQFNVAEGGSISENMPYMAKILVKRIKSDPRVNVMRDWKMITHMIGDNDFCSEMCYYHNPEVILTKHRQDLLDVLRILKRNLPRTIVNIVPPPHLRLLTLMKDKPPICHLTHSFLCPCIVGLSYVYKRDQFFDIMKRWQELDIEISNLPEFDLDDFTVIPQNFTLDYTFPTTAQGGMDYSYLSADCFHFSEKGQSRFANDLWNSIMEPFGNKSNDGSDILAKFNCPSEKYPFIFTRRNSPGFLPT